MGMPVDREPGSATTNELLDVSDEEAVQVATLVLRVHGARARQMVRDEHVVARQGVPEPILRLAVQAVDFAAETANLLEIVHRPLEPPASLVVREPERAADEAHAAGDGHGSLGEK